MTLFILTFLCICLAMLGMALGVIFSGRSIRGSCGGNSDDESNCRQCAGACEEE